MLTVADFVNQYQKYSDIELYQAAAQIEEYSPDGQKALQVVVAKRGGFEELTERAKAYIAKQRERERLQNEVHALGAQGTDLAFLKTIITSEVLSEDDAHAVIQQSAAVIESKKQDETVKFRSIVGSLIGGAIAALTGGVALGYQILYMSEIRLMYIAALLGLSYACVWLCTRQTYKNLVVIVASIISTGLAFYIALWVSHFAP